MSAVAVTGAAGFIGAAMCRRLVAEGHSVVGIDIDTGAAARVTETGAQFRPADTTDRGAVRGALDGPSSSSTRRRSSPAAPPWPTRSA